MSSDNIKHEVQKAYGRISNRPENCCSDGDICCKDIVTLAELPTGSKYKEEQLSSLPEGTDMGLGCGNPTALASLKEGETVVDLGSGGGIDCFLAAKAVGPGGRVIGIDMTPEMINKARVNAQKGKFSNVEFRLGEIENIPVDDNEADCIISNCVINLSPDKQKVFAEAYRILKPGGRLMVSDIVLTEELPDRVKKSVEAYVSCIAGAEMKDSYLGKLKDAGFTDIEVLEEVECPVRETDHGFTTGNTGAASPETGNPVAKVSSVRVSAKKPG